MIRFENEWLKLEIEAEPEFRVTLFQDKKNKLDVLTADSGNLFGDRTILSAATFISCVQIGKCSWKLIYETGPVTVTRFLECYETAPAIRWYDILSASSDIANMYYSDLAKITFASTQSFRCWDSFSCSDQSNHRFLNKPAVPGKNKGGYFVSEQCWIYKEGPMPDGQPVKGEYDFLWNPAQKSLSMVGLGFNNLHPGEKRRVNGTVIGLSSHYGMQRYRIARYAAFPKGGSSEVLANSWPDLTFKLNEESIMKEIQTAPEAGVSVVFIDGGWYDLFMDKIDEKRFPNQFHLLFEEAKKRGVEIGLWMNPLGLDVRHPKMALWDGAECHDAMLEKNPWNWAARTNDFVFAEAYGSSKDEEGYAGIELMNPEVYAYRKQQIIDMYKTYRIRHFKFDLYRLDRYDTLWGDANLHYECYRKLLTELQQEIPELIISMDVTRRERPNFDFALDYGRLFLENRGRRCKDHRYYHPYMALGNFWDMLHFAPGIQMEIEMMPQAMDYPLDYILGTTIFGAPLYWGCIVNTPPERRAAMKLFYEKMLPMRKKFAENINLPVGEKPVKGTWSGILSITPDEREFYLAVYRNGSVERSHSFTLPAVEKMELLYGQAELSGENTISMDQEYAFALYHGNLKN